MPRRGRTPRSNRVQEIEITPEAPALIRAVHAIPNGPNVDIVLDGRVVLRNVPYKVASDYLEIRPGNHLVQVNVAGTTDTVLSGRVDAAVGDALTIVAHGDIANKKIALLLLKDDNSCPVVGDARVRFVHASFAAPRVNVYANKSLNVFPNVGYGEAKVNSVPAGVYDLSVTPTNSSNVVLNVPSAVLEGGHVYSVFAVGIPGNANAPLGAILTSDSKCLFVAL
jgi:hypothetical protein